MQLEPLVFDESLDEEDDGKAGIKQILQRDSGQKRIHQTLVPRVILAQALTIGL